MNRIFRLCDLDNDGALSDAELAHFQRRCFHMDLESGTLESLKAVVAKNCEEGMENEALTSTGILKVGILEIINSFHIIFSGFYALVF